MILRALTVATFAGTTAATWWAFWASNQAFGDALDETAVYLGAL